MDITDKTLGLKNQYWKWLVITAAGLLLFAWLLNTPAGLLGKADAIGYAVCHRIDLRSFHLGERQLPLCARCSGMYLGAVLSLGYQAVIGRRKTGTPPWGVLFILGSLLIAFAVDGLNSYLSLFPGAPSLYHPNNTLRLLTGTGMGVVIAVALYPAFNLSVWKETDARPAIGGVRVLGVLLILALLLDAMVLTENPLVLYPLALVSAFGVMVLLTMVYSMLWLMVFKLEGRYNRIEQLILPLVGGFAIGLVQIGILALVRYFLTSTWEGFHLG